MRIEQLKYLVAVADWGSFTAASMHLYVAQPSISQSIAALEKELGVTLLNRTRAGVEPTEIGKEIILHARTVLSELERILSLVKEDAAKDSATIAGAPVICSSILPMVMGAANVDTIRQVEVVDTTTDRAEHMLLRGEADFALVPYVDVSSVNSAYVFSPLFTAQTMAVVHSQAPLARRKSVNFEEIQKHPISIFSSEYISYEPIVNRISKYGEPNIILKTHVPRPVLTKTLAANLDCIGISFDVAIYGNDFIKSGEMHPLYIDDPVRLTFGLLMKKDQALTPLGKSLQKQIHAAVKVFQQELDRFHDSVLEG